MLMIKDCCHGLSYMMGCVKVLSGNMFVTIGQDSTRQMELISTAVQLMQMERSRACRCGSERRSTR